MAKTIKISFDIAVQDALELHEALTYACARAQGFSTAEATVLRNMKNVVEDCINATAESERDA